MDASSWIRYRAMMEGATADRPPCIPLLMRFAAEAIGQTYGAFAGDHRILVAANRHCAEVYGLDHVATISDPYREVTAFGGDVGIEADLGPVQRRLPLRPGCDLSAVAVPDPRCHPRMADRLEAVRLLAATERGRRSILGWVEGPAALAADAIGIEAFLLALSDDPSWLGDLMTLCVDTALRFAREQVALGADTVGIGDAIASQVSPRMYERLVVPHESRLVAGIQAAGAWVRLHICGNITRHLPAMAGVGADLVDCDHMVDLAEARRRLGPAPVLAGNLDPVAAIQRGEPERIRTAVELCRDQAEGRYAISGGSCWPPIRH